MKRSHVVSMAGLVMSLVLGAVQPAAARTILIDFDSGTTNEHFPTPTTATDGGFAFEDGAIPFDLNFTGTSQSYGFCFRSDGAVAFVSSTAACGSIADPTTGDFAAPLLGADFGSFVNPIWGIGTMERVAPYDDIGTTSAGIRFIWDGDNGSTELMLIQSGTAGDFDMEFRYGNPFTNGTNTNLLGGLQGFTLGSNVLSLTAGPFDGATGDYLFSFRNGVCVSAACSGGTTPTPVPEPGTLSLFGLASLGMLLATRRRRRFALSHQGASTAWGSKPSVRSRPEH